ncbi:MAG: hypothetical protein R2851_25330 [Caldilineaceae bacterium]
MTAVRSIDFRHAPPDRWTCIGRPDDPHKTLVDQEGRLLYHYARDGVRFGVFRFQRVVSFALQTDAKPVSVTQCTEDAATPIVVTEIRYPHATLTLRAAGHAHAGLRTDIVQWQIDAHAGPVTTALWLQVQDHAALCARRTRTQPVRVRTRRTTCPVGPASRICSRRISIPAGNRGAQTRARLSHAPLQVASAYDHGPASGLSTDLFKVEPERACDRRSLPTPRAPGCGRHGPHVGRRCVGAGTTLLAKPAPGRNHIDSQRGHHGHVDRVARNILQAREVKDGLPEFQVGPTVYRRLWVIDGYFFWKRRAFWAGTTARPRASTCCCGGCGPMAPSKSAAWTPRTPAWPWPRWCASAD